MHSFYKKFLFFVLSICIVVSGFCYANLEVNAYTGHEDIIGCLHGTTGYMFLVDYCEGTEGSSSVHGWTFKADGSFYGTSTQYYINLTGHGAETGALYHQDTPGSSYVFCRMIDDVPDPDPIPSPVDPEQIHFQHAAKAELLPEKNTDGSYKLNAYGVPVIVCSECGQVHSDFAVAHEAWLDEVENAVKNHKNFGTDWKTKEEAAENPVTIITSTFISFDKDMLSYLNSQPDAVILKFKYQGKYYVTTIPSDFDCLSLADENGWAGFAYIMSICGGREISEEEFKM